MKKLLEIPEILIESTDLYEFVHNCPQLIKTQSTVSNEELINQLYPSSIVIEDYRTQNSMKFSTTEPLPPPSPALSLSMEKIVEFSDYQINMLNIPLISTNKMLQETMFIPMVNLVVQIIAH